LGYPPRLPSKSFPRLPSGRNYGICVNYEGLSFNTFTGDAIYLGPTFFYQISPKVLVSAAWDIQVAGHETGDLAALDLTDFSHQRARLLLEFEF
jgi:hypothetical protein